MKIALTILCCFGILTSHAQQLGINAGDAVEIGTQNGTTPNLMMNKTWLYRTAAGNTWNTASVITGVAVDVSFLQPKVNTRVWWDRNPYTATQTWGNQDKTYMGIYNGLVGIGTSTPKGTFEVEGSTVLGGANIDPRFALGNLSFLPNSYQMVIGWNRSGGGGEMDFIANQGGGNVGGFAFYDYSNAGVQTQLMTIQANGAVGIGTATPGNYKLAVKGKIHTQEVNVDMNGWADYVFDPAYTKLSLPELEQFILQNKHLPNIPTAAEVSKDGVNLGEMNKLLLQKIEELTLHLIDKNKAIVDLESNVDKLTKDQNKLKADLDSILNKLNITKK